MTDMVMLVPSRGRPESVARMAEAWGAAGGIGRTELTWVLDHDDPKADSYNWELSQYPWMRVAWRLEWVPMVPKLNWAACLAAGMHSVVGFMGDDHLPRSPGWDEALFGFAMARKTAILYGQDGYQNRRIPTWWAMTSDVIKALGRMVPAPVQHLYCDNAVKELGERSKTLDYLPHVMIEHMHPVAGKAEWDDGYTRVNRGEQYDRDRAAFEGWLQDGAQRDATLIAQLRGV
jgi:hypothetical protein